MTPREQLAAYLRRLRIEQGLTLRAAGERTGVTHSYYASLEAARPNANITLDTLVRILDALGGSLHEAFPDWSGLSPEERHLVDVLFQAIRAAREDDHLAIVLASAIDMVESRLTRSPRASG